MICVDTNVGRIAALRRGESYIEDIPEDRLRAVAANLEPTTRASRLALADAIIVCVPTPLTANREPDLGPLTSAAAALSDVVQAGQLIVLESTTYPGTTRERVLPLLEETGLRAGRDFHVAFSPERVDPGRTDHTLRTTPKIVGGLTPACRVRAEELYSLVCDDIVPVSTLEVAEMAKLLENIFRSVNIALVNELGMLADRMAIDIWEVVDAAATKPFGFMRFEPGPGMGGHCLPVDPFYLSWKARELDFATEFIELAGKVNQQMPHYCVQKVERALNDDGKPTRGSKVAVLGVAYKPGVGDTRESPGPQDRRAAAGARGRGRLPRPARPEPGLARALEPAARAGHGRRGRGGHRHGAPGGRPHGDRRRGAGRGPARRHPPTARRPPAGERHAVQPSRRPRVHLRAQGSVGGTMQRLLIIADHSFVVQSIRLALRQTAGFQVVGFVDGRVPAATLLAELAPDVVLVDDMQDSENALARLREVSAELPEARSLLLTLRMDPEWLEDAFEAGAGSVISKTVHPVALGTLLREITHGNVVHRFRSKRAETEAEECPLTDARAGDPAARRRGADERQHRPRAVGHRADGEVPPLQHLPQARRGQPHRGQPVRLHARPGGPQ